MGYDADLLLRKLEDGLRKARGRPAFLGFLDEGGRAWQVVFLPMHYQEDNAICEKTAAIMHQKAIVS